MNRIYEPKVVEEFLKADRSALLFGGKLKKSLRKFQTSLSIIDEPNLKNKPQNLKRKQVLANFRYFDTGEDFFKGFPNNTIWYIANLSLEDLFFVIFINSDVWLPYTDNTRKPELLAQKMIENKISNKHTKMIRGIQEQIDKENTLPMMIFVSTTKKKPEVVLEGHHRLAAYILHALIHLINQMSLNAIVGVSPDMTTWKDY